MRRILVATALAAACASPAMAQQHATDRGAWKIRGSAGFDYTDYDGGESWQLRLNPGVGYFITPGLSLDFTLSGRWGGSEADGGGTPVSIHSLDWAVGPGITWYFRRAPVSVHPYVGAGGFYGESKVTSTFGDFTTNLRSVQVYGGALWMLARNAGITTQLYWDYVEFESSISRSMGVEAGVAVFVY